MRSDETLGVIRPGKDGKWWAAHGVGSATCELGWFASEEEARVAAAADSRQVIRARAGETGYLALAREQRAEAAGDDIAWMHMGSVAVIVLGGDAQTLDTTLALASARYPSAQIGMLRLLPDHSDLVLRVPADAPPGAAEPARRGEAWRLELTPRGLVAWDARGRPMIPLDIHGRIALPVAVVRQHAPAAGGRVIACAGLHERDRAAPGTLADPHRACPWCHGTGWQGDLEDPPSRREPEPWHDGYWTAGGVTRCACAEPVGAAEIAQRLGVQAGTVHQWRKRGEAMREPLPEPEWEVSGQPAWPWGTIAAWALATGREILPAPRPSGGSTPAPVRRAQERRHRQERDPEFARHAITAEVMAWNEDPGRQYLSGAEVISLVADDITAGWLHRAAQGGYPGGLRGYTAGYIAKTEGYAAPDELNGVWSARVAALRATGTTSPATAGERSE